MNGKGERGVGNIMIMRRTNEWGRQHYKTIKNMKYKIPAKVQPGRMGKNKNERENRRQ